MGLSRQAVSGLALAASLLAAGAAQADCKLLELAEFHVDPNSRVPVVDGEVNGKPVKVLFDTGSTFSMIPRHEAERLGLVLGTPVLGHAYGIGGQSELYVAQLKELKIGSFVKSGMQIEVAGDRYVASDVSVVLGDDFFSQVDTEFDLPENVVRLFKPAGCSPDQLVYWGAAYSQARLLEWNRDSPDAQTLVLVNGKQVLAGLDTGSEASSIDAKAADAAGVQRPAPNAASGAAIQGLGAETEESYIGHFDSFAFGDEKVNNVKLQVLDLTSGFRVSETGTNLPRLLDDTPSLYVGADFFRAHRIYIDVRDHLILFSYVGGPVFSPIEAAAKDAAR
jgi:predicted aspartyl protease